MSGSASRRGQCFQRGALRFNGAVSPKRFVGSSNQQIGKRFPWLRPGRGSSHSQGRSASPANLSTELEREALRFNGAASPKRFIGLLINQGSAPLSSDRAGVFLASPVEALPPVNLSTEPERERFGLTRSPRRSASLEINLPDSVPFLVPPVKRFAVERETYRRP